MITAVPLAVATIILLIDNDIKSASTPITALAPNRIQLSISLAIAFSCVAVNFAPITLLDVPKRSLKSVAIVANIPVPIVLSPVHIA